MNCCVPSSSFRLCLLSNEEDTYRETSICIFGLCFHIAQTYRVLKIFNLMLLVLNDSIWKLPILNGNSD